MLQLGGIVLQLLGLAVGTFLLIQALFSRGPHVVRRSGQAPNESPLVQAFRQRRGGRFCIRPGGAMPPRSIVGTSFLPVSDVAGEPDDACWPWWGEGYEASESN